MTLVPEILMRGLMSITPTSILRNGCRGEEYPFLFFCTTQTENNIAQWGEASIVMPYLHCVFLFRIR